MPTLRSRVSPGNTRTSAHASNQLTKKGVKHLLSVVRGQKVDQSPVRPQHQATPRNLSASPDSSDDEEEEEVSTSVSLQPVKASTSAERKRKAAPSDRKSQLPRKARAVNSRRVQTEAGNASGITSTTLKDPPDEDLDEDEKIFFSMKSSQTTRTRTYGSQGSHNIHTASGAPKGSETVREKKGTEAASGFKRPRALPDNDDRSPLPIFKRPPALAESPRSSFTNTFRAPRSSPPLAVAILTSSAPQTDDDSPLSSPPPSPELDAWAGLQPIRRNGILTLPCPLCHSLVPQANFESFNNGRSLRWTDKVAFCQAHKAQEIEAQRSNKQYPAICWPELPARMNKFHSTIEAILERRNDSYYRNIVDDSVATGQQRNAFRAVEGEGLANAVPGYYGLRGARIMQEHILAAFSTRIRRLAGTDKAIPRTGPAGYVQTVLAPEMATLLVMEDFPGIDAEQARSILAESVEVGKLMADNDDDAAQSKSFLAIDEQDVDDAKKAVHVD